MAPFLRPLKKLRSLFLSRNNIATLDDGDINFLVTLRELSLDHNRLQKVCKKSKIFKKPVKNLDKH